MEKHELIFITLYAIRPSSTKFEGKYFYKLIRSKGWQHASWVRTQNSTIHHITTNLTRKWPKWNEITQRIWLWVYQEQFVILSVNQGLAINLTWPALKNNQRFELFEVFLTSSADQCFFCVFFIFIWNHFPMKHPTRRLYLIIGSLPLPGGGSAIIKSFCRIMK